MKYKCKKCFGELETTKGFLLDSHIVSHEPLSEQKRKEYFEEID